MNAVTVSSHPSLPALRHPWSKCITVGRAYELLRADLQEHLLRLKKEFDYRFIRFHASFHDDVAVVHKLPDGQIVYRWTQLDHIYDFLVEAGFDPIVEINPMPKALASGDATFFWYKKNITPPASYEEWERFMQAYIEHTVERYGIERVRNWRFEVWNEPNLRNSFWTGTQEEYFELYASCARILKGFDSQLKIGGPAGAGFQWNGEFLHYCKTGNVPVDFVSYHVYPVDEADKQEPTGLHMVADLKQAKQEVLESGFGDLEILITEWNTQTQDGSKKVKWVGNESINRLIAGAMVCHFLHESDDCSDAMGWWVASDVFEEGGPQVEVYGNRHQHYGMLTMDGIPKSSYHAFSFMHRMRGKRYAVTLPEGILPTRNCIVTDEMSATRALIWNTWFPFQDDARDWDLSLELPLPSSRKDATEIRQTIAHVKKGHGSAFEAWQAMGAPANLTVIEQRALEAASHPQYTSTMVPVKHGRVSVSLNLGINEFAFLEIGGDDAGSLAELSIDQHALNDSLQLM